MPKVIAYLALLASLVLSATAAAQPTPHPPGWVPVDQLPTVQSGRLGQPAAPVPGVAGATLFNAQLANEIGAILARLKKAKDECKPDDYQRALADWERVTRANQDLSTALAPGSIQDVTVRGRAHADDAVLNDLRNSRNFPR